MRIPDVRQLAEPVRAPTFREAARDWQASRIDVREATTVQHRSAVNRVLPLIGHIRIDEIAPADVAGVITSLDAAGAARETIRKSRTAIALTLDHAGVSPNPARDGVRVRLPRAEPVEVEPPSADHIEAVARLLAPAYQFAVAVLDATGCRVGEFEAARIADLDESRHAWLVRAAVSKTRRPRWVCLPDDLWATLVDRLPPGEHRDSDAPLFGGATADRLRTAIARACQAAGVPHFSPHALRHRRISLLHKQGVSWAEIGELVGQRSRSVTADVYSHALVDPREVNRAELLIANVPTSAWKERDAHDDNKPFIRLTEDQIRRAEKAALNARAVAHERFSRYARPEERRRRARHGPRNSAGLLRSRGN